METKDPEDVKGRSKQLKQLLDRYTSEEEVTRDNVAEIIRTSLKEKQQYEENFISVKKAFDVLYKLSMAVSEVDKLENLYKNVVTSAIEMTGFPAGSLALFNEKENKMVLAASYGFSEAFTKNYCWPVRPGGLTAFILNNKDMTLLSNLEKHPIFYNPIFLSEKIQSLMAITLRTDRKIVGILYVNDFKPHNPSQQALMAIKVISTIAGTALWKAQAFEESRLLSITDELTGLFSYRYFLQQLSAEVARTKRYHVPTTLIMMDMDHFKQHNDTHGHLAGNHALSALGNILKMGARENDTAARYGGDEFALIMPETSLSDGIQAAKRLRRQITDDLFVTPDGKPYKVTVSVGVASIAPEQGSPSVEGLIKAADRALYKAKAGGRDQVYPAGST